ncbi:MAG: MATE family efflux transporter [Tidjanibacter sp.]|nr:MATE family efflux transporter [Tidjanibacter sp.]
MSKTISLSDHFTTAKLLRYTMPTIAMMIFTSIYSVVDGIFVSNFAGKTPFAAINLIYPLFMVIGAIGFMTGTGGSALVAKILGEGDQAKAHKTFSLIVYFTLSLGIVCSSLGLIFLEPIATLLGAEGDILDCAIRYGRILLLSLPFFLLQGMFQPFMVAADRPSLGFLFSLIAGLANILLDYLFIVPLGMGLEGAACATAASQFLGGTIPMIYFLSRNGSMLRLGATRWDGAAIRRTCANGSSEMATNISISIVVMLYNSQLLHYIGEDGVAAFGVIGYLQFVFIAIFLGYSIGSAPIVSYNYGAARRDELKGVVDRSLRIVALFSLSLTLLAELLSAPLSRLFVGYDAALYELTRRALSIYSVSFLLCGLNIYASSLFTALNNGLISALISFSRTLIFECGAVLLIPLIIGIDGIWWSVTIAEAAALVMCTVCYFRFKERYHY